MKCPLCRSYLGDWWIGSRTHLALVDFMGRFRWFQRLRARLADEDRRAAVETLRAFRGSRMPRKPAHVPGSEAK